MYPSLFSPVATTTNSDQFNFQILWHWSEILVVATEEKIDQYLLAVKGFIFSSVEILVWMSFDLNNLDANTSEAFDDQRRCILGDVISENYFPVTMVDTVVMFMAKAELFMYVDPSNYGLVRPKQGHFTTKFFTGRTPGISVGTSKRFAMTRFSSHIDDWSSPNKSSSPYDLHLSSVQSSSSASHKRKKIYLAKRSSRAFNELRLPTINFRSNSVML
ncbi:hypothetical protein F2Q69_00046481 [Brassica cretica]|uniref:Uncharacterized protein n=1 Tax=Brassica cretica TaxID=69181 RepID=A0A8S9PTJ6_BRACR|nr:hypothetical protein F2Q69_00046481 [Brassica cretica]